MFENMQIRYCCSIIDCYGGTYYNKFYLVRNKKTILDVPKINDYIQGFGVVKSINININQCPIIQIR